MRCGVDSIILVIFFLCVCSVVSILMYTFDTVIYHFCVTKAQNVRVRSNNFDNFYAPLIESPETAIARGPLKIYSGPVVISFLESPPVHDGSDEWTHT